MELVRLIENDMQYIFDNSLKKIDYNEEIENENRLFVKIKTKYKTSFKSFCGKKITLPESCDIVKIEKLNFFLLSKVFEFWNISINTEYLSIEDHPFSIWRNNFIKRKYEIKEKTDYFFYENIFFQMGGELGDFSQNDELYERVSSLGNSSFITLCLYFFDENYLLYSTDFCRKLIQLVVKYSFSRQQILEISSKWKDFWINSIEFSLIITCPTTLEEYFEKISSLYIDFSKCTLNDAKYIIMFTGYENYNLLYNNLLEMNVDFDCIIDHNFFGEEFLDKNAIDVFEEHINDFYEIYVKYIIKNNIYYRKNPVNISISNVLIFKENCYDVFLNSETNYKISLIVKTFKFLNIEIDRKKISELLLKLKNEQKKSIEEA